MRLWTWLAAGVAVVGLALGVAWLKRASILTMIAHSRLPHVEPNRPVTWAQGPDRAPAGERPPNALLRAAAEHHPAV